MKRITILFAAIAISLTMAPEFLAKTTAENDSIKTAVRLKTLQNKKESLQKEIKSQDAKRNKQISGVSPETMEEMNNRQDSVCLALRSELTEVMLEIKELSPNVASPQLINQMNNLLNRPDSVISGSAEPLNPSK